MCLELHIYNYLQIQSPTSIIVKWRTLTAVNSRVSWGNHLGALNNHVVNSTLTMEHEVLLSGLNSSSKFFFQLALIRKYILVIQEQRMQMPKQLKTDICNFTKIHIQTYGLCWVIILILLVQILVLKLIY